MTTTLKKSDTILYWTFTILLAVMMAMSAIMYLTADAMKQAFDHLGFPSYFRVELAIAKLLGAIALIAPIPPRIKEWAYAGFFLTCLSAFIAHTSVDGVQTAIPPVVCLAITALSYWGFRKRVGAGAA